MSSSIIKSDNGVTSGVTGIISSGGSDGTLLLQTTSAGGTATTAVTIDNSQNFLVGKTITSGSAVGTTLFGASGGGGIVTAIQGGGGNTSVFNVVSGSGTETQITFKYSNTSVGSITSTSTGTTLNVGTNGGVTFNNSSAVSSGQTLNDYETGTWTPTLGGTSTMSASKGTYTKIGNYVFVAFDFTVGSIGSANGWTVSGLPFSGSSPSNSLGYVGSLCYGYYANLNISVTSLSGYMNSNTTSFYLTATTSASTTINQNAGPNAILTSGSRLIGSLVYQASF